MNGKTRHRWNAVLDCQIGDIDGTPVFLARRRFCSVCALHSQADHGDVRHSSNKDMTWTAADGTVMIGREGMAVPACVATEDTAAALARFADLPFIPRETRSKKVAA